MGGHDCQGMDFGGRRALGLLFQGKSERGPNSGSCSRFFWKESGKSGAGAGAQQSFMEATLSLWVITALLTHSPVPQEDLPPHTHPLISEVSAQPGCW